MWGLMNVQNRGVYWTYHIAPTWQEHLYVVAEDDAAARAKLWWIGSK